jgi:hypothetical protein
MRPNICWPASCWLLAKWLLALATWLLALANQVMFLFCFLNELFVSPCLYFISVWEKSCHFVEVSTWSLYPQISSCTLNDGHDRHDGHDGHDGRFIRGIFERPISRSQIDSAMVKTVESLRSRFLASAADSLSVAEMKACYSNQVRCV